MQSIVLIRYRAGSGAALLRRMPGQCRLLSLCTFRPRCGSLVSGTRLKLSTLAADNTSVLSHIGRKHKNPPWRCRRQYNTPALLRQTLRTNHVSVRLGNLL